MVKNSENRESMGNSIDEHCQKAEQFIAEKNWDAALAEYTAVMSVKAKVPVKPGLFPLNGADGNSISLVTGNFAISYLFVRKEIENTKIPVRLIVMDTEGYSVPTAWALSKFTAEGIANFIKENMESTAKNKTLVTPGILGPPFALEIEECLPGWRILAGPKEAGDILKFLAEEYLLA